MVDVVFVHPNASTQIYQSLATNYSAIEPPIWAAMLQGRAIDDAFSTTLIDAESWRMSVDDVVENINSIKPRLIVIVVYGQQPSASTQNMTGAELLSKALKENFSGKILFVGAHPSALPAQTLLDNNWAMVCQGEGPETIKGLLQRAPLNKIPGLWYIDENKIIQHNEPAALIQDLDNDLAGMSYRNICFEKYRTSNWHAFSNNNNRGNFASIYTSLGCPYHCTFCMINAPFGGSSFRYWKPSFIIKHFEHFASKNITNIKIADEMFVLNPNHFMRLCEEIIDLKANFNIWAYARVDTVKEKYLETLKEAGVNWLALGIESGNKAVRGDVIKGKFEDLSITDTVKKIHDHGINVIGNFIFGLPEDNHATMRESLDLAKSLKLEMANFYSAMAYPGSKLYVEAKANGTALPAKWSGYSQHSKDCLPLPTKYIRAGEVLKFRDVAFTEFFNDPSYHNTLLTKFGQGAVDDIKNMLNHTLERDNYEK